jgi:heme/copper-type cytochrome/quinol oxidase subunit 4
MDLLWNWVVATGFMLSIILTVGGFVILAPV